MKINGDVLNNTLNGSARHDAVHGFAGDDLINGFAGNDVLYGGFGTDTINGGDGNDRIRGFAGADVLNGDNGDDKLFGNAGNDSLSGGAGNDTLDGGIGIDSLNGGTGNDLLMLKDYHYNISLNGDTIDGGDGTDTLQLYVNDSVGDGIVSNVENIKYTGFYDGIVDTIVIDFGGMAYNKTGITSIDLTGFGAEDKLVIAERDGALVITPKLVYPTGTSNRRYISENINNKRDFISWKKGDTKITLSSAIATNGVTYVGVGQIEITGLPANLENLQLAFV